MSKLLKRNKKYNIIYADPPWHECGGGKIKRGANRHYELMKTKDIMNLDVKSITANNAHLYLWSTNCFLPDALKVIEAWGFRYRTVITWVKDRFGLGQYFRGQTEQCLFAVKGFLPYKINEKTGKRCQAVTYFFEKREKHSKKPKRILRYISTVSDRPGLKKIELFARQRREGWDAWGNEIESDIIL